ncbi:hypothetical protein COCC4DRAFT_63015 [Bipolaris maydis ATCC 48331]|uniref:Uncharacterized protein n=2 Tax=Cochliobolus heterostrophus TaxID=5016 RepID=M2TYF0_COCH5|nr:uncharacterized protein COCC4DRAFT_63015 [Bipolaris maydis ATCC 48331]EMD86831.1 hypothetical protein COCHEDRAFT_1034588 [Bipolaris maydis C5]KAJ5047761.1 hypothetical protein J3E74DRAFT_295974 [Bipolaris maydis]ENI03216.1 hypothetical protein COCC4DRAFT_63015 [Bipolaris maydis ATCC 48331]KAJ6203524.1 hypothetical protein PSV09DRAFT_1034588 [Bipolaris maydis]KAJ6265107.1 hypothetical protein PSV08DRAFT_252951 [Bipolaris maydis]
MSAFNFNILENTCVSKTKIVCFYNDGAFYFDGIKIIVGNSSENNSGGIGGFVGPNHEYFLYCGSKYPEIAVVRFNSNTNKWEDHACMQWFKFETDKNMFKSIWFTKEEPALIFQPKKAYREHVMKHKDLAEGMGCIKLNLSTGRFTGISRKQFEKQRHSALDKNSVWPPLSSGNGPLGDGDWRDTPNPQLEHSLASMNSDREKQEEMLEQWEQMKLLFNRLLEMIDWSLRAVLHHP